jgi:hypothetical protein
MTALPLRTLAKNQPPSRVISSGCQPAVSGAILIAADQLETCGSPTLKR